MDNITLQKGKIPPQAIDLEKVVLGALIVDQRGIYDVVNILVPDAFYQEKHTIVYREIMDMFSNNSPIDLLTLSDSLRKKNNLEKAGGDFYLIELTQTATSSAHIEYHSRIILQKYIQREVIKMSTNLIEEGYNDDTDVFDLLDNAYNRLNSVTAETIKQSDSSFGEIIDSEITKARKIYNGEIKPGITTPIKKLTKKSGGWRNKELIILAARPSMGKTALALKFGLHTAKNNIPVLFFSMEMGKEKLTQRLLSMEAKIEGDKFNIHGLSQDDEIKLYPSKQFLSTLPIHIDDTSSLSIETFQIKAKLAHRKHKIGLIIVDYLQLMSVASMKKGGNREQEISKISRGLKQTGMDLNIPVIALSQLSRAVETRGGSKRPILSDLRESGAIEQDADMVMFLFRPEYYSIPEWDDYDNAPTTGEAEYIVAKNRNGALVRNRMKFESKYTLFSDLIDESQIFDPPPPPLGNINDAFEKEVRPPYKDDVNYDPDNLDDDLPF